LYSNSSVYPFSLSRSRFECHLASVSHNCCDDDDDVDDDVALQMRYRETCVDKLRAFLSTPSSRPPTTQITQSIIAFSHQRAVLPYVRTNIRDVRTCTNVQYSRTEPADGYFTYVRCSNVRRRSLNTKEEEQMEACEKP
jgi:hypothetical protein